MDDIVVLEWTFSPPDYFEDVIHIERGGYTITIDNGKIEARLAPALYDKEHRMRDELHDALNDRFLGVQLLTYKKYKLSQASMSQLHPDGHKDITLFAESIESTTAVETIDIVIKDKDGNIISDSRRDRIEEKKKLAELVEKFQPHDIFLESMLSFYKSAINDPNNELVHLFDVWEAIGERFGGKAEAQTTLGINKSESSKLGRLANNEPLLQGRHRGKKVGELRQATETELEEARGIARNMIKAYLHYLDHQNNP